MNKYTTDQRNSDLFDVFNVTQFDDFYGKAIPELEADPVIACVHALDSAMKMLEPQIRKHIDAYNSMQGAKKKASSAQRKRKSGAGRPGRDPVDMVRLCLVQRYLNLSDLAMESSVRYDIRVRRAVGWLTLSTVPDRKTIWKYRNLFDKCGLFSVLFADFTSKAQALLDKAFPKTAGKRKLAAVDSTFNEAPEQRNTREENAVIKEGKGDTLWNDNPNKKCHKDIDARWTKKRGETHFGYKLHVLADMRIKLIVSQYTTDAAQHDSRHLIPLLNKSLNGSSIYVDSGYTSDENKEECSRLGINLRLIDRPYRNKPLTEQQNTDNHRKSRIRIRIEHIFGYVEQTMRGLTLRCVGYVRAASNGSLTCLMYNIMRMWQLKML